MYKQKAEPNRGRLRFVRTITFVVLLLLLYTAFLYIIPQRQEKIEEFIEYRVAYGDTYWELAKRAQEEGLNMDIREIIHIMINKSGIKASDLREGDIIYIPKIKGEK